MIHGAFWYRMTLGRRLTTRFAAELAAQVVALGKAPPVMAVRTGRKPSR